MSEEHYSLMKQSKELGATLLETSLIAALIGAVAIASVSKAGMNVALTNFVTVAAQRGSSPIGAGPVYGAGSCLRWAKDHAKFCNSKYPAGTPGCSGESLINHLNNTCPS